MMEYKGIDNKEAYNKGLNDAWEFISKLIKMPNLIEKEIFGYEFLYGIVDNYTPQEALAKLEAYEKEQNEIKVGDVVFNKDTNEHCMITHIEGKSVVYCLFDDGSCGTSNIKVCKKTGKHIDIQKILDELKEGVDNARDII